MTDLMRMLYEFITLHRMGRAWDAPEYRDFSACAQKKEAELREKLDREETQLLEDMLRELSCRKMDIDHRADHSFYNRFFHGFLHRIMIHMPA